MDDTEKDLQAGLTHATDRLIRAARTLTFWICDDDDLPPDYELPSQDDVLDAVGEVHASVAEIQFIRLEIAGQMALFDCNWRRDHETKT